MVHVISSVLVEPTPTSTSGSSLVTCEQASFFVHIKVQRTACGSHPVCRARARSRQSSHDVGLVDSVQKLYFDAPPRLPDWGTRSQRHCSASSASSASSRFGLLPIEIAAIGSNYLDFQKLVFGHEIIFFSLADHHLSQADRQSSP